MTASESPRSSVVSARLCVLAAAVLWSAGGAFTKSLAGLNPNTIAFYRSFWAGLVLLPVVRRAEWTLRPAFLISVPTFAAMIGFYIGSQRMTTAANAIFLQCTATFWMVPLAAIFLRERPDWKSLAGILVATPGIVLILLLGHSGGRDETLGIILGLASGFSYAVVVISLRGLRGLKPIWLSSMHNLGGSLLLLAWVSTSNMPVQSVDARTMLVLAVFGVFQMAIPYALFARGLRSIGAPEAALIALIEPVLNPIWTFLVAGERPRLATVIGGLFLVAGVAVRYAPWGPARVARDTQA